jgi:hypothetical protein
MGDDETLKERTPEEILAVLFPKDNQEPDWTILETLTENEKASLEEVVSLLLNELGEDPSNVNARIVYQRATLMLNFSQNKITVSEYKSKYRSIDRLAETYKMLGFL